MVHLMKSGNVPADPETAANGNKLPVKLEIVEDPLEEEHGPLSKRSKTSQTVQQWGAGANAFSVPPTQYNPLDEPSPLGLRLRKSPSLLDLIQMRLSQGGVSTVGAEKTENNDSVVKKDAKTNTVSVSTDKLKASNFPASILRIGSWEYKSRYEGELVAKCYFAKHKLVWEVLEGGLKSKIEIQWSDIMALKANCPDDAPGTLTVVLARQPLFFRETNPQPRKHTLWQATADFTDGQASTHRQHFLLCPQGLLNKHFEKLIQCDMRLNFLSRQPDIILDSPYFEQRSVFEDPDETKGQDFSHGETGKGSSISGFQDLASPSIAHSSSLEIERGDHAGTTSEIISREAPSPSSVMCTLAIEGNGNCEAVDSKGPRNWDQIKVPGLHPSMSMSDFMNHIENCISEQITSGNPPLPADASECQNILEDIAQYLLSDTQLTTSSDEKRLMARVNSLCCLLQKEPTSTQNLQQLSEDSCMSESDEKRLMARVNSLCCLLQKEPASTQNLEQLNEESCISESDNGKGVQVSNTNESLFENIGKGNMNDTEGNTKDVSGSKQVSGMSRKDSFGELLLHLPRIASLPKFLFNISEEDGEGQAR